MSIDWRTLRVAADRQAGLLTRRQCRDAGLSDEALQWRVSSRRWSRWHEGVYLTTPGRNDVQVGAVAALLSVSSGDVAADAALCGRSAAHLWGLERRAPSPIELVVPHRRFLVAPAGVRIRRSRRWDDLVDDLAYPWRTTVAATVLDLAGTSTLTSALALVAKAVQQELVTTAVLSQELGRRRGHRHGVLLRSALQDVDAGGQSAAELLYIRDVERAHGLPQATRQQVSDLGQRRYHDNEYDAFGLIVEVDGRLGHEQWGDRVRDGRRDRQLLAARRATTRVFWQDVAVEPCVTALDVGRILQDRGWVGAPRACRRRDCAVPDSWAASSVR